MRKRKIKFALELKNGQQVRNIEELREAFDLEKVIGYFQDGKLVEWLEDRFCQDEAEAIKKLSENDPEFGRKLCDILGAEYAEVEDAETIKWRKERLERLKQYTADASVLAQIDWVAFDQEDLEDIMRDEELPDTVYLCQNTFTFPSGIFRREKMHWIGIGKHVKIQNKEPVDFDAMGVTFDNIEVEYQPFESDGDSFKSKEVSDVAWYKRKDVMEELIFCLAEHVHLSEYVQLFSRRTAVFSYNESIKKITKEDFEGNDEEAIFILRDYPAQTYGCVALTNHAIYFDFGEYDGCCIPYTSIKELRVESGRITITSSESELDFFYTIPGSQCTRMLKLFLKIVSNCSEEFDSEEKTWLSQIRLQSLGNQSVAEKLGL